MSKGDIYSPIWEQFEGHHEGSCRRDWDKRAKASRKARKKSRREIRFRINDEWIPLSSSRRRRYRYRRRRLRLRGRMYHGSPMKKKNRYRFTRSEKDRTWASPMSLHYVCLCVHVVYTYAIESFAHVLWREGQLSPTTLLRYVKW